MCQGGCAQARPLQHPAPYRRGWLGCLIISLADCGIFAHPLSDLGLRAFERSLLPPTVRWRPAEKQPASKGAPLQRCWRCQGAQSCMG